MSRTIEELLAPKPDALPRIYAYSIDDQAHRGLLKIGQTTRDVKRRVAEQLKTAAIRNYKIELDVSAEREDGTIITDHEVRAGLVRRGFENTELEWMRCTVADARTVLAELHAGRRYSGTHHETFQMRREQVEAVDKTHAYFHSVWNEDMHAVPRFLWNAKMRFGKTFTTFHDIPAREDAGRHAGPCSDLQARRGGCLAVRPGVARGLRWLAIPLAQLGH